MIVMSYIELHSTIEFFCANLRFIVSLALLVPGSIIFTDPLVNVGSISTFQPRVNKQV